MYSDYTLLLMNLSMQVQEIILRRIQYPRPLFPAILKRTIGSSDKERRLLSFLRVLYELEPRPTRRVGFWSSLSWNQQQLSVRE